MGRCEIIEVTLGEDGIRQIWHDAKLRGRGYSRSREILQYAERAGQ